MATTAYEAERIARIEANHAKMKELGIEESVAAMQQLAAPKPAAPRERKRKATPPPVEPTRKSARPRAEINYAALLAEAERGPPRDYTEKIKMLQLDSAAAERLRAELEARRAMAPSGSGKNHGPKDSGKGVRVQGGRVYDSTFGVTCHWCRQKTLEAHVTCTHPKCAASRMPYSFCHKCLRNRHGEEAEAAAASGCWVCPSCRGSCGPGCVICCNCGPCRKKASLEPTAQIVHLARSAGFGNVHDYLVHLVTGEAEEEIAARKIAHGWGRWLRGEDSDASAETRAARGSEQQQQEEEEAADEEEGLEDLASTDSEAAEGDEGQDSSEEEEEEAERAEGASPAAEERQQAKGRRAGPTRRSGPAPSPDAAAVAPGTSRKAGGSIKAKAGSAATKDRKRAAAAPAAVAEAANTPRAAPVRVSPPVDAVVASDQDGGAPSSRKARMMARMGLAPRS